MTIPISEHICAKGNELWVEGCRVTDLAERYGTPLFITSENQIRHNYRTFHHAFGSRYPGDVLVCVGMKANWGLATRKIIVQEGGGGDAFGLGELYVALLAGTDPEKIVMNGTNKAQEVLEAAVQAGIHINVDDPEELDLVADLARSLDRTARISLRIRLPLEALRGRMYVDPRYKPPGVDVSRWEREFKFGMEPEMIQLVLDRALGSQHLDVAGLHYHGGIPRRAGFSREETAELMDWVAEFKTRFGWEPRSLNLGGGYPKDRYGLPNPHPLEEHAEAITTAIQEKVHELDLRLPQLILEPGRWCWEDAALYVARVGAVKQDRTLTRKKWVYVDGSINEMGDPFDPFNGYHHCLVADRTDAPVSGPVDVCGPLCNAADRLATDRSFPEVRRGDVLAFLGMGAYNEAFANQANAMPRSATVLVSGTRAALMRRRETLQDVFGREEVPHWLW